MREGVIWERRGVGEVYGVVCAGVHVQLSKARAPALHEYARRDSLMRPKAAKVSANTSSKGRRRRGCIRLSLHHLDEFDQVREHVDLLMHAAPTATPHMWIWRGGGEQGHVWKHNS